MSRSRSAPPALTFILRWQTNGEHVAAVIERATKRRLAIARGTESYARRASELFAVHWERARRARLRANVLNGGAT